MINPFKEINWNPGAAELKGFGRSLLYGFTALSAIFLAVGIVRNGLSASFSVPLVLFAVGIAIFALSSTFPRASRPLYLAWFFMSACIGIVVSNLALAVFFYLAFSPYALIVRALTGRDPLMLKRPPGRSCWHDHAGKKSLKRYFRQY